MTILSKLQMREYVSKDKLYSFIQSGLARTEWTDKNKRQTYKGYVVRNYEGEIGQMNYYLEHMDENGMYYVEYDIPAKLQGRHKIPNCLTSMRRVVRNYLLCDDYYDFDMVNSFASILYMLAMKHNFRDYKILQDFINNRTDWIEGLMKELKKDKDDVKEFIITVVYSKPDADEKDEKKKIKWNESKIYGGKLRKLKTIITSLTATLRNTNLYNIDADRDNLFGCWISNLVMSIEDDIVVGFLNYIIVNYPLLVRNPYDDNDLIPVGIYELDGFKLLKRNVDEFGGPNAVIGIVNEWLLSFGFNTPENQFIQFSNKSMDDKLTNIPLLQYPNQLILMSQVNEVVSEVIEEIEIDDDDISSMSSITSPKSITISSDKIKELNADDLKNIIKDKKQQEKEEKQKQKQLEKELKEKEREEKRQQKQKELEEKRLEKEQQKKDEKRLKEMLRQNKEAEKLHKEKMKKEVYEKRINQIKLEIEAKEKTSRFAVNDAEASILIYDDLKDKIKNVDGNIYYKTDRNVWISNLKRVNEALLYYIIHTNIRIRIDRGDEPPIIKDYAQNTTNATNIRTALISKISNQNDSRWLMNSLSSSIGKILFNNGYLDFYNKRFVPNEDDNYDKDIVFFEIIDRNYRPITTDTESEERKNLEKHKKQLFHTPFTEDVGNWYILQLARGIAGDAMKRVLFGIGNGNTGKSLITSILKECFGSYVGAFNGENLIFHKNKTTDEGANMRWVLLLKTRRIIFSSEIKMGCQIDGNIVKKLSNGGKDELTGREHCSNETQFKVVFLPIIFANDIDDIKPCDDAVVSRIRAIPYNKVFVDGEPKNEYQLKKVDEYNTESPNCVLRTDEFIDCFIQIIFESYCKFIDNNRIEVEPTEIVSARENVVGDIQVDLIEGFLELFEITNDPDDFTPSCFIEEDYLKKRQISLKKFGSEMKKYLNMKSNEGKYNNVVNDISKNVPELGGRQKKCWIGIKKKDV
jgi:phage/plasmid-associated DNA primase